MRIGIIVLARMSSTRLPNKVLKVISGRTVLEHVAERLRGVGNARLVVATTENPKDDLIAALARSKGWDLFRGDEDNVLKRCLDAVRAFSFDVVIRLGADSPLVDGRVIDEMLDCYLAEYARGNQLEYLSNTLDRSYPVGLDAEIFAAGTFSRIDSETANLPLEERRLNESNVVPYLHRNLSLFNTHSFKGPFDYSHIRLTLDTPEDLKLIQLIYDALYPQNPDFLLEDILDVLRKNPEWMEINSQVVPVTGYWTDVEKGKLSRRMEERKK